jgi:hypothetical protein
LHAAGGCGFPKPAPDGKNPTILWTAAALPSVVALCATPTDLSRSDTNCATLDRAIVLSQDDETRIVHCGGNAFRVHLLDDVGSQTLCAVLPMDRLFDIRISAARRLWHALDGRASTTAPTQLPAAQRQRLVHALQALDARLDNATYREIAAALFGEHRLPERGWKTHDLRDRTIRLARLGHDLMQGGYRQLLLYPFRQKL